MGPRLPARWKTADVCGSEEPREKSTAGAPHTTQEKAKASAKKSIKGCLRAAGLTLARVCGF